MIFFAEITTPEEPRPSALYAAFAGESAANEWTSINNVAAARIYTTVEEEYAALDSGAALVDLGVQRRYAVRGYDAGALLGRLTSAPVKDIGVGESARGLILDSTGRVVDFCDVTRLSGDSYLATTTGPIDRRLAVAARGFDVTIENISETVAALGLFGPYAAKVAAAAGFAIAGDALASHGHVRGVEAFARPTAMGRASGVEIIFPAEEAITLWERVRHGGGGRALGGSQTGRQESVQDNKAPIPVGVEACEIMRIEGGVARPGVDFTPADQSHGAANHALASYNDDTSGKRRPPEIGAAHLAPLNRAWFNGRRAMGEAEEKRRLTTLVADADHITAGAPVFAGDAGSNKGQEKPIGRVTSAAFSPRYRAAICFVDAPFDRKTKGQLTIALDGDGGQRAKTRALETPESHAATAFEARGKKPTESRGFFV
ncbi:MAG: glycine cleavage T C-terminal barrel domain-containing protein [Pseudomonadota bacterium]